MAPALNSLRQSIDKAMTQAKETATISDEPASMGAAGHSAQNRPAQVNRSAPITQGSTQAGSPESGG